MPHINYAGLGEELTSKYQALIHRERDSRTLQDASNAMRIHGARSSELYSGETLAECEFKLRFSG